MKRLTNSPKNRQRMSKIAMPNKKALKNLRVRAKIQIPKTSMKYLRISKMRTE